MRAYIEFGWGNRWLLRTEVERDDGTEYEQQGIVFPHTITSLYIRMWIGRRVIIIDSREGLKCSVKPAGRVKLLIGLSGEMKR